MILERCKGVHCVDLGERFLTRIYLQKMASIQPRTSPLKFARSLQVPDRRGPGDPEVSHTEHLDPAGIASFAKQKNQGLQPRLFPEE